MADSTVSLIVNISRQECSMQCQVDADASTCQIECVCQTRRQPGQTIISKQSNRSG